MTALLFALSASFAAFLGGWVAFRHRDRLHLILALAAGLLLGAAFFELLPESLALGAPVGLDAPAILGTTLAGFVTFYLVDTAFGIHPHQPNDTHRTGVLGTASLSGISLHSFLDGLGIGAAFQADAKLGILIGLAVTGHRFSDGLNTIAITSRMRPTTRLSRNWLIVVAVAPVAGVLLSYGASVPDTVLSLFLAYFAGMFFYVAASDLLPEAHHTHQSRWTFVMTLIGIGLLLLLRQAAEL